MKDAPNPQFLGHFDKHGSVVNVNYMFWTYLRNIQSNMIEVGVRLAVVDKAGRNKKIYECSQPKLLNAIDRKLAAFIADGCDLEAMLGFGSALSSIISGKGWDWAYMNALNSSRENERS
jgi:hypothetical protein